MKHPEILFNKREIIPDEERIREILGDLYSQLQAIRSFIHDKIGDTTEEWKYYGIKNGWILKTYFRKRNLFFTSIFKGYFQISFVFGEKAVAAVQDSDVPGSIKRELSEARQYAEGRGLSIQVEDESMIRAICKLIEIKVQS